MNDNNLPHPLAKKIIFSGNCPQCEMKDVANEMLLNSMDFFECPECHLQTTAFPDAVAILKWRGEGDFRQTITKATAGFVGQQIFAASYENEIMPNKEWPLIDFFDLEEYLFSLHRNNWVDRKSTRLNSRHDQISYAVFCLKKKKKKTKI